MTHFTDTRVVRNSGTAHGLAVNLVLGFSMALFTVKVWYDRSKQRRHLHELDDYLLRDIGLDRITAMREAAKPFWRG